MYPFPPLLPHLGQSRAARQSNRIKETSTCSEDILIFVSLLASMSKSGLECTLCQCVGLYVLRVV